METTATQQGLNEVVTTKVQRMIDKNSQTVLALMGRLMDEGAIAQDYIAPLGVVKNRRDLPPVIQFAPGNGLSMQFQGNQFQMHDNAIGQVAEKMGVPIRYLRELSAGEGWQQELAARILNEHTMNTDRARVLIRAVGSQVRAVLSDSYRRLNSQEIVSSFVTESNSQGAVLSDGLITDTKLWLEAILPMPITIPTKNNGDVVMFVGARFSTSDYGNGSVDMRTFLLNGVCLNGMVRESVINQRHLGARLADNLALSQRTYDLDTKTTVSAIRDLTRGLFNRENILRKAVEIQGASEIEVDMSQELKKLISGGSLLKEEGQTVEKILMQNRSEDGLQGASTLWKLTQAITAHAREVTPVRMRELHEISGELMKRVPVK